jgi:hypothetical protein
MRNTSQKATLNLMVWTATWVVTVAIATFGPKFIWDGGKWYTILALGLNLGVGIGMILANKNFLDICDELQKKIQLEAMGLTLGATLVGGIAFSLMDQTNLIRGDAEIGFLVLFMGLFYMACIVVGNLRYR